VTSTSKANDAECAIETGCVTVDRKAVNELLNANSSAQVDTKRTARIPNAVGDAYSGTRAK
jgi:hypothetical protein